MTGRAGQGGFTLVELLIALTLFGLISLALFGGLRFGTRAWETAVTRSEVIGDSEAIQGLLRRQISQAMGADPRLGQEVESRGFQGEPDFMQFTAPMPSFAGIGGIYDIAVEVVEEEEGQSLVASWRLARPDDLEGAELAEENEARQVQRDLLTGAAEVRFRYFGSDAPGEEGEWRDAWEETERLPLLVAIEVEFPEGDGRNWPELVVAPHLTTGF